MSGTRTAERARGELGGFEGELIGPEDEGYDEARTLFNAMMDKRPALIVRCARADQVGQVIAFAREEGLPIAVCGGGHNGGGLGSVDDGVVIDLSLLRSVSVDPGTRTVRVGGGCTWADVDAATHAADGPGQVKRAPLQEMGPLLIPDDARDPISGAVAHRSQMCSVRRLA